MQIHTKTKITKLHNYTRAAICTGLFTEELTLLLNLQERIMQYIIKTR